MKLRNLAVVAFSLTCTGLAGGAALAHDITPYICGGGTDAKSGYANVAGQLVNSLSTQAGGTSKPGFTCTNIDDGNALGPSSLIITVFGTPTTANGPYVFVTAHDAQSNLLQGVALVSKGHVGAKTSTYTTYVLGNSTFGMPKGSTADEFVMQIFPGTKAFATKMYCRFNGATFNKSTTVVNECPGGNHP